MIGPTDLCRLAATAVVASALVLATAIPSEAQVEPPNSDFDAERRSLLVVDATGSALETGQGTSSFGVALEGEDECPGDSTHDGYRVDSYVVPVDVDPTSLDFSGLGPHPTEFRSYESFQMPLVMTSGNRFAAKLTGDAAEAGGPGPIRDLPPFDFGTYVPTPGIDGWDGGVPAGTYRLGLACTFAGRITNLWETTIEVTADPADTVVGMRWTVTGPQPTELESGPSRPNGLVYGLVGIGALAAVASLLLHRSARSGAGGPPSPHEAAAG